jgi:hypothetical protein
MTTFTIDTENSITAFASKQEAGEGEAFATVLLRSLTAMRGRAYEWTDVVSRVMQRCRIARQ